MTKILDASNISWGFLDKEGSICCGRPLLLAGQLESARALIDKNASIINSSGSKILVTSCPICYKAFKEEYKLDIEVLHHSQFILRLIEEKKIFVNKSVQSYVYHDPCELGRNSGIYSEPRKIINHSAHLINSALEKEKSLCCGGSIGNILLTSAQKMQIASEVFHEIDSEKADALITGCPLCKRTFSSVTEKPVLDIAQLVASNLIKTLGAETKGISKKKTDIEVYSRTL
jgi:Fe-S oxidoreductase